MSGNTGRHFSAEDKVKILRLHLVEGRPVADLCDEHGLNPSVFYQWQRVFFENGKGTRPLFTPADLQRFIDAAAHATKNAVEFCDYIRFLEYTGAREQEVLKVRWADVDFEQGLVTIGADGALGRSGLIIEPAGGEAGRRPRARRPGRPARPVRLWRARRNVLRLRRVRGRAPECSNIVIAESKP